MPKLTVRDVPVASRRVLVRVDFNVPLERGSVPGSMAPSRVADDTRIRATLPTLEYLIQQKAKLILCSHLGRPKGKPDPAFSLRPVAERLRILLDEKLGPGIQVGFCPQTVGLEAREMAAGLEPGHVLLLENLRFQPQEEANDPGFSQDLASLAELFVNDAFGSAHRAHASTVGVTQFLRPAVAGFLMERELRYLGQALDRPRHPFVVILGGAKVADKLPVLESLARHADVILVGGGMAYTFLAARGEPVGASLCEPGKFDVARKVLAAAQPKNQLRLPVDHVVAEKLERGVPRQTVSQIPAGQKALDIGPQTCGLYAAEIAKAKTIVWNGPMGVFEIPPFDQGTLAVARAVAQATSRPADPAISIAGGGDSVAAIEAAGVASQITHVSTGGGASLEFLAGVQLPGVAALTDAPGGRR